MTDNDTTKRAARYLIERGLATYAEVADLADTSRQAVRYWAKDIPDSRSLYLRTHWEHALKRAKESS
jgi:TPP-dependent pyruvate/acetoin dehydrogenase alpha subunit